MRSAGMIVMIVGALVPRAAGADDDADAKLDEPRPHPKVGIAVLFALGSWDFGPLTLDGNGADIEVNAGVGKRGQVALEGFITRLNDDGTELAATHARLGLTARWHPRAFHLDDLLGIEMYLEGGTGLQRTWFDGGGRVTRQDITFGSGLQYRFQGASQVGLRMGVQFLWAAPAPLARLDRAVCRGSCPDTGHAAPVDVAFMGQMGLSWGR